MFKDKERINRKIAFNRVRANINKLLNNEHTFENIFNISFSKNEYTLFETTSNVGINKIKYIDAKKEVIKYAEFFSNKIQSNNKYIGIHLDNSPSWIYSFYGLLMAGFVPVLLSTKANDVEIKSIIKKINIKYLISDNNFEEITCFKVEEIKNYKAQNTSLKNNWANEIVFMTSGVSNEPKLASYTGEEITQQIASSFDLLKMNYSFASSYKGYLKHLVILPFYHIFGLIAVFIWFSFFNVTFVIPNDLRPQSVKQACLMSKVTHIFAVPLFWNTLTKQILNEVRKVNKEKKFNKFINLSIKIQKIFPKHGPKFIRNKLFKNYLNKIFGTSISFCITGGGNISKETLHIVNGLGYPLSNGYGATEIGITSLENSNKIMNRISGTVGYPIGTIKYILDKNNSLLVTGKSTANKIMVNNKWEKVKDKSINTNDLVTKKNNGYFINGRLDNLYVSKNGENYSLENIEETITLPYNDSYSLIVNDKNDLCLILSYPINTLKSQISKDINAIVQNKNLIKLIKNIYITSRIIPMSNGIKIKRRQLLEDFNNNKKDFTLINALDYKVENEKEIEIPLEVLNKIIDIYKEHFDNKNISKNSNFYMDLKGDSLSYFLLLGKIEKAFNCTLKIDDKNIPLTPLDFSLLIKEVLGL